MEERVEQVDREGEDDGRVLLGTEMTFVMTRNRQERHVYSWHITFYTFSKKNIFEVTKN